MILGKDAPLEQVIKELQETSKDNVKSISGYQKIKSKAKKMLSELKEVEILSKLKQYRKIDKLINFDLTKYGVKQALVLTDEIKKDIKKALGWITTWFGFSKELEYIKNSKVYQGYPAEEKYNRLVDIGLAIKARAVDLCPKDTGELARSATLAQTEKSVIILFPKYYAMYVHENMNVHHPIHGGRDCGGRAKFLEIAVQEVFPTKQVDINLLESGAIGVQINLDDLED